MVSARMVEPKISSFNRLWYWSLLEVKARPLQKSSPLGEQQQKVWRALLLLDVLLGGGYPILTKAYEAVFRKDRIETIKYYPARTRVGMKGVTKAEVSRVLAPLANGILEDLPDHVRLALRWYGKGISEEHPVDKFISLYECSLAIVSRRHYNTQTPTQVEMHLLDECLETGSGMPSSLKTTSTRERSLVRLVESSGSETAYSRQTTLVSIRMRLRMWSLARHRC